MYESLYALRERPFQPIPSPQCYYPGRAGENARATLERVIERGEGPCVLIGPAGTGKTMLCRVLAAAFQPRYTVVTLDAGAIATQRDLYRTLLHEMRIGYRGLMEGELRLALLQALAHPDVPSNGVVLIVDEAHLMRLRLIEELRLLTNIEDHGHPRVRLVLAADGYLEERLANPRLESLHQRLAARCYLCNFDRDEVGPFLSAQAQAAGAALEQLFYPDATAAIAAATDGNPRLINQLADHTLVCKALQSMVADPVTADDVQAAWADLQQLPAPWNADSQTEATTGSVIEFGPLGDDTDAAAEDDNWVTEDSVLSQESADEIVSTEIDAEAAEDEPVIVELPQARMTENEESRREFVVMDGERDETRYEDPFDDSFEEEQAVPLISDSASVQDPAVDRTEHAGGDLVPVATTEVSSSTQIVASSASWLPLETLWVTPGVIPELPADDRDLVEITDAEESRDATIPRPHAVQLLGSPQQLSKIRE